MCFFINLNMDWMSSLPTRLQNLPLTDLAIPGSHNSMTYSLDVNSDIANDISKALKVLVKSFFKVGRSILYRWSLTQNLSAKDQLQTGIRYFDLRIGLKGNSEICFVHGLYGMKCSEGLDEINQFLDQHPKEVVLLDFNHFYDMSDSDHHALVEIIQNIFKTKLCPSSIDIEILSLTTMWERKYQVIVFYQNRAGFFSGNVWPSTFITSPWPNTADTNAMISFLDHNFDHGRPENMFYVTQGILTPDTATIMANPCSDLKAKLAVKANSALVKWLEGKRAGSQGINIVVADFVELKNFISTILSLNGTQPSESFYKPI